MSGTNTHRHTPITTLTAWTLGALATLGASAQAAPEVYTASHDTFVQEEMGWIPGGFHVLYTKHANNGAEHLVRNAVIRFDRTNAAAVENAVLTLHVAFAGDPEVSHQFRVWGLADGAPCEAFSEASLTWEDCDLFGLTIDDTSASLYDADPNTAGTQSLGEFYVFDHTESVRFSSDALTDFIANSSNDTITLVIERTEGGGQLTHFAATEHSTLPGPVLEVNVPAYAHLASVSGVSEAQTPSGLDADGLANGIRFAQAVSYNGSDPGRARVRPDGNVFFEEADNGAHTIGDAVDIVALMDGIESLVPMEKGSFEMESTGATTVTLEPVVDTYVREGSGVQNSAWGQFGVTDLHHGLLRFERPIADATGATLQLTVGTMQNDGEFYIWGLKDSGDAEVFDPATITYADLPFLDRYATTRTTEDLNYLHDSDGNDDNHAQPLGVVNITSAQAGTTVSFSNQALIDFINADADGNVSFLIVRGNGSGWSTFIANEHATLAPPQLTLDIAAVDTYVIEFENTYSTPVFFAESATHNGSDALAVYPISVGEDYAIVRMAEGANYDNVHVNETIHWAVMEAGYYDLQPHGHLEVGLAHITTTGTDDFATITPIGAYFDDSAAIIAHSQYNNLGGYQGTRVRKNTANGSVTGFDVRFMLDRVLEIPDYSPTSGTIGWMVIGDGTPTTEPGEIPVWLLEGGEENPFSVQIDQGGLVGGGCDSDGDGFGEDNSSAYFSTDDSFGNDIAGAGYAFAAGVTDGLEVELWAGIAGSVDGQLMGANIDLLDIGAVATRNEGSNTALAEACVVIYGCLIEEELSANIATSYTRTLLTAQARFFGITVQGDLNVEIGFEAGASPGASGLSVSATPYLVVDARASVSAGCCGFKVSVRGNIEVFNASLPTTVDINVVDGGMSWAATSSFDWSALAGSLKLKFKALWWSKTKTIASWSGISGSIPIIGPLQGCLPL